MEFQRLLPHPGPVDSAELFRDLGLAARAPADRPYLILDFAATADGRIALDGRSRAIGDEGDTETFRRLRTQADALLVGTGTLETEAYGKPIRRTDLRAAREAIGLAPDPPLVTIARSGRLPLEIPLFADPDAHVIAYVDADVEPPACAARVDVHRVAPGARDAGLLAAAMRHLRTRHGVRSVLCEGGPRLLTGLLHEGLVDELFLTVSPQLAGGDAEPGLTRGTPLADAADLTLLWALERRGSLYLRYGIDGSAAPRP